jgi:poly-D-alanine transfer protein DltD
VRNKALGDGVARRAMKLIAEGTGDFDHFRDLYYKRIRGLAQVHDVPLVDFEDHDLDEDFLADDHDHLTDKGWLYFDKALDDFFHDRLVLQPGT